MAGYTRQSAADIVTGAAILALPLNTEFNAIQAAFHGTTGHTHDGTSGNGPLISLITGVTGVLPVARGGFGGIHKLNATVEPTINDDSADGYVVGSHWVDTVADQVYTAIDVSPGAAVWKAQQDYDLGLQTLALFNTNGFVVQTSNNNWAGRTLTAPAAGLTISNPAGTAGNPTFALANDLAALEGLGSTGIAVRSAADTWAQRTITGTANQITVTNGNGVSGNPTLSFPTSVTIGNLTTSAITLSGSVPKITFTDTDAPSTTSISGDGAAGSLYLEVDGGNTLANSSVYFLIDGGSPYIFGPTGQVDISGTTPKIYFHDSGGGDSLISGDSTVGNLILSADYNNIGTNTVIQFIIDGSERGRMAEAATPGFLWSKTSHDATTVGISLLDSGAFFAVSASNSGFYRTADGNVIAIGSAGTTQGFISVAGATVTYGAFLGSHWTRFAEKTSILKGTVVESTDEFMQWEGEPEEDRLVACKISDTVSSKRVYGTFFYWDEEDDHEDAVIMGVGAGWVRIAAGVTVKGGDLLDSNGDGCAKVQDDDLVRSSTIAKVSSNQIVETYPDGSYLVSAILMCG